QCIKEFGINIDVHHFVNFSKKTLDSPNPELKKAIIFFLTQIFIFLGPKLRILLDDLKPALLNTIDLEFEKVKNEKPTFSTHQKSSLKIENNNELNFLPDDDLKAISDVEIEIPYVNIDIDRVDISNELTTELLEQLNEKNWKIRNCALDKISQIIKSAKYISPNIGELPSYLCLRLNDANKNLILITLNICKDIVESMGNGIHQHRNVLLPAIFGSLTSSKVLIPLIGPILACASDRNSDTRKSCQLVIGNLAPIVGVSTIQKHLNSLDANSQNLIKVILDAETSRTIAQIKLSDKSSKNNVSSKFLPDFDKISAQNIKSNSEKEENLLISDKEKLIESMILYKANTQSSRIKDSAKFDLILNIKEFQSYLNSQLSIYLISTLQFDLFSPDFKKQACGIKTLSDLIIDPSKSFEHPGLLEISDLILGYAASRLVDGNPAVISKCFELTDKYLNLMLDNNKLLISEEADYILSALITRIGDCKDSYRKYCQSILNSIIKLYPISSVFGHLIIGLDAKASKVRSESLNAINNIIQSESITLNTLPNFSKLCIGVAKVISDRDSASRIASLNFFSILYNQVGDKVYDYTAQIGSKEQVLIRERIKRLPKPDLNKTFVVSSDQPQKMNDIPGSPITVINNSNHFETAMICTSEYENIEPNKKHFELDQFLSNLGINVYEETPQSTPDLVEFETIYKYRSPNIFKPENMSQIEIKIFTTLKTKFEFGEISVSFLNEVSQNLPTLFIDSPISTSSIQIMHYCLKSLLNHLLSTLSSDENPRDLLKSSFAIMTYIFFTASFVHYIQEEALKDIFIQLLEMIDSIDLKDIHNLPFSIIHAMSKSLLCLICDIVPLHILLYVFLKLLLDQNIIYLPAKRDVLQYCINIAISKVQCMPMPLFVDINKFLNLYNDHGLFVSYPAILQETTSKKDMHILTSLELSHPNVFLRIKNLNIKIGQAFELKSIADVVEQLILELEQCIHLRFDICKKIIFISIEHNLSFINWENMSPLKPSFKTFLKLTLAFLKTHRIDSVFQIVELCNDQITLNSCNIDNNLDGGSSSYFRKRAEKIVIDKLLNNEKSPEPIKFQPLNQTIMDLVDQNNSKTDESTIIAAENSQKVPKNIEDLRRRFENIKKGFLP
ncbi:hypothetical protein MXB_633, partial [Myxobolus squamalis]